MAELTTNFNLQKPQGSDPARMTDLNGNWDTIDEQLGIANKPFLATSNDGIKYYVTVPGITELYEGLTITIIPARPSNIDFGDNPPASYNLSVNGLPVSPLHLSQVGSDDIQNDSSGGRILNWLSSDRAIQIVYVTQRGTPRWQTVNEGIIYAKNLFGTIPIRNGGTGGYTLEKAQQNLGITDLKGIDITRQDPFSFDYFIARNRDSRGNTTKSLLFTIKESNYDALELRASATEILPNSSNTTIVAHELYFYWGATQMCECSKTEFNIGTGGTTNSSESWDEILGFKLNHLVSGGQG